MGRLLGRRVVVTGAAGNIGRAVCDSLLDEGAAVLATDLTTDRLPAAGGMVAIAADVSTQHGCAAVMDQAVASMGGIDSLVTVAGAWAPMPFALSTAEQWEQMIRANLLSTMHACHAALPHLAGAGSGSIVTFASTAGEQGAIYPSAAYSAAKGGVIAFTKALAREVGPLGVRVNAVSPGDIGRMMLTEVDDLHVRAAAERTLLGRVGQPEDVAHAVVYLVSEESSFVTGEVVRINGGSLL